MAETTAQAQLGLSDGAKPDEIALWVLVVWGSTPRAAGRELDIAPKRVLYLCEKWARRRIYNYGVCADVGWVEL